MRRLDRTRPYGQHYPVIARRAFVQDGVDFDSEGNLVDIPAADTPSPAAVTKNASQVQPGGVFVSDVPVAVPLKETSFMPRTKREWMTTDFRKLKKEISTAYGVEPTSRSMAIKILDNKGLIKGE